MMATEDPPPVDAIAPLRVLAEEMGMEYERLRRYADVDRNNQFPEPVERIANVKFYERAAVERWLALFNMTGYNRSK